MAEMTRFTIFYLIVTSSLMNECQRTYQRSCECEKTVDGQCAYTLVLPVNPDGKPGSNQKCAGGCLPPTDSTDDVWKKINGFGENVDSLQKWTGEQAKMMVNLENRMKSLEQRQIYGTNFVNVSSDYRDLWRIISEQTSKLNKLESNLETFNDTMTSFMTHIYILLDKNVTTDSKYTSQSGNPSTTTAQSLLWNYTTNQNLDIENATTFSRNLFFGTTSYKNINNTNDNQSHDDNFHLTNKSIYQDNHTTMTAAVRDHTSTSHEYSNLTTVIGAQNTHHTTSDWLDNTNTTSYDLIKTINNDTGSTQTTEWNTSSSVFQSNYSLHQLDNHTTMLPVGSTQSHYNESSIGNNNSSLFNSTVKQYLTTTATNNNSEAYSTENGSFTQRHQNVANITESDEHNYNYNRSMETTTSTQHFMTISDNNNKTIIKSNEITTSNKTSLSEQNMTSTSEVTFGDNFNKTTENNSVHWTTTPNSFNNNESNMTSWRPAINVNDSTTQHTNFSENFKSTTSININSTDQNNIQSLTNRTFLTNEPMINESLPNEVIINGSVATNHPTWNSNNESDGRNIYDLTTNPYDRENVFTPQPVTTDKNNFFDHEWTSAHITDKITDPASSSFFTTAGLASHVTGSFAAVIDRAGSTSDFMLRRKKRNLDNKNTPLQEGVHALVNSLVSQIVDLETKLKSLEEKGKYICSRKGLLVTNGKGANKVAMTTTSSGVNKDGESLGSNAWCIKDFTKIGHVIEMEFSEEQRIYALMIKIKSSGKGYFYVSHAGKEQVWNVYASPEGTTQIFSAMNDELDTSHYQKIDLWQPIIAKSIRIHPIMNKDLSHGGLCFSIDLIGCLD